MRFRVPLCFAAESRTFLVPVTAGSMSCHSAKRAAGNIRVTELDEAGLALFFNTHTMRYSHPSVDL